MATTRVNLRIDTDLWHTAQKRAATDRTTTTAVVTAALTEHLTKHQPAPPPAKTTRQPPKPATTTNTQCTHPPIKRVGPMCLNCGKPWR